ncbi:3-phosphoserine/phosphohydroxythreonine transaminase [Paenibacillus antri]|uniref:Phosphoserine aminotransferase n=1 Tax=Paenibacillus antri TaxID=2582848 RepID=A0A5R9GDS5_9BACL|nr:3-phosphoserine/phosphohydroxythreonine transaminase [Paenibacillus antri]TLS52496.1 3-phosphoserine/phosphohydroxythreonine transaminase [Paenibacillus antri]
MTRKHNFNPGPAVLPLEVLEQARQDLTEYGSKGMSLMEMSHRSKTVERMMGETEELLKELLDLPDGYRVLFMGGGASTQFAFVPMNFLTAGKVGQYVLSGSFSEKAFQEAQVIGVANVLASGIADKWQKLPELFGFNPEAHVAYVHLTTNNTIEGTQFRNLPNTGDVPLIADMTSDMLSRRLDWTKLGLMYAGAQKNLGPAGVTVVIVREDLLKASTDARIPTIFKYATFASNDSLYNTPPVHTIYVMKLMLEWTKRKGGLVEMEQRSLERSDLLYDVIDRSGGYYEGFAERASRSRMNVTWRMRDEALARQFVCESEQAGFEGLAGHRSVGGLRASIYNALPVAACEALADFMQDFQRRNG